MELNLEKIFVNSPYFRKLTYPFAGLTLIYLILIQYIAYNITNDDIKLLIYPVKVIAEYVNGVGFHYDSFYGYVQDNGLIRINKSCSGFIFINVLISIAACSIFMNTKPKQQISSILSLGAIAVLIAYIISIIANTSRVILGIKLHQFALNNTWFPGNFAHELFGILYFFFFSILFYIIIKKIIHSWNN